MHNFYANRSKINWILVPTGHRTEFRPVLGPSSEFRVWEFIKTGLEQRISAGIVERKKTNINMWNYEFNRTRPIHWHKSIKTPKVSANYTNYAFYCCLPTASATLQISPIFHSLFIPKRAGNNALQNKKPAESPPSKIKLSGVSWKSKNNQNSKGLQYDCNKKNGGKTGEQNISEN